MGSSQTRAWTRVPCIGRSILNHWATREVHCPFSLHHTYWASLRNLSLILFCTHSTLIPPQLIAAGENYAALSALNSRSLISSGPLLLPGNHNAFPHFFHSPTLLNHIFIPFIFSSTSNTSFSILTLSWWQYFLFHWEIETITKEFPQTPTTISTHLINCLCAHILCFLPLLWVNCSRYKPALSLVH